MDAMHGATSRTLPAFKNVDQKQSCEPSAPLPTVLVVEDDAVVRSLAVEFLQDDGFQVLAADDAASAIALLEADAPIDAVFSDVQMPGAMDGLGLARWISREKPGLKVLLTSGKVCDQPGRPVLAKPYEMGKLAQRLKDLIEH
jgi:CheY-like chemotaxis protein